MARTNGDTPRLGTYPRMITLVLIAAVSPLAINMFVPSIPAISAAFGAPYATVQLGLSLYLAATAVLQLAVGPVADRMGRRPVIIAGLAMFLIGTVMALFSPNIAGFLAGRILQAGSAASLVLSRVVIRDLVSREKAASAIGYVTMGMSVAPMIGPAIGGILDEHFGWQASFILLLVIGIAVLAVTLVNLPETKPTAVDATPQDLFSGYGKLLASPSFLAYVGTSSTASAVFFGFLGGGPAIASGLLGLTPATYGIWFAATAAGYMLGNYLSGRHAVHAGVGRMVIAGGLVTFLGTALPVALFWFGPAVPVSLFAPMFLIGVGNGLTLPSAAAGAISVNPALSGAASGLLGAVQVGAGAVVSVLCAIIAGDGHAVIPFCLALAGLAAISLAFAAMVARGERKPQAN